MYFLRKDVRNCGSVPMSATVVAAAFVIGVFPAELAAQTYVDVAADVGLSQEHSLGTCPPPIGNGSAWADFDNDGDIDLYVTNQGTANHLYCNLGDTDMPPDGLPNFADVAVAEGVSFAAAASHSAVFIDYDNDGDQDLYVTNWGDSETPEGHPNVLYQNRLENNSGCTCEMIVAGSPCTVADFLNVTAAVDLEDDGRALTTAWGDFDADGLLDVYMAKHRRCNGDVEPNEDSLYHQSPAGTFTKRNEWLCGGSPTCPEIGGYGFAPGWVDFDNDGDADLYLVNDNLVEAGTQPNMLWRNDGPDGMGGWNFTEIAGSVGAQIGVNGMGLGIGDYDNDGWLDFAFSNIGKPGETLPNVGNVLLRNQNGMFSDQSAAQGIERPTVAPDAMGQDRSVTWGTVFFDHDNNGYLDLLFVAGFLNINFPPLQPNAFFANTGGTFSEVTGNGLDDPGRGRNASIVDFDQDGFVDVFIANLGQGPPPAGTGAVLLHNTLTQNGSRHWLTVTVEGRASNRDGIGTRLTLSTPDGMTQIREITSGATHGGGDYKAAYFGMGSNTTGELSVRWPSGVEVLARQTASPGVPGLKVVQTSHHLDVLADQQIHLVETTVRCGTPVDDGMGLVTIDVTTDPTTNFTSVSPPTVGGANPPTETAITSDAAPIDQCTPADTICSFSVQGTPGGGGDQTWSRTFDDGSQPIACLITGPDGLPVDLMKFAVE